MDDTYIEKVLQGDIDAFRFLIKNYKDMGYSLAISIVKNEFLAQEVLQTAFIKAYSKLNTFKGTAKFSSWLYRIIVNEAFKVQNKKKSNIIIYNEIYTDVISENNSFSSVIDTDYQKYYINEALKRLQPKESLVLRLFYLEENNIKDIQDITGWSIANIKILLHRGRINIKRHLKID
ncbi:RNA polymerase sigma factor [Thalassobellus citreus]|uniref:RNA polymerase sigma factor n=1 Tax=Thalassobellus citreus TaxID=3367752 RepID=UPI00378D7A51